ncbi:MAG: peptidylprolyl isomerase [Actinomycetota bacterium]|nr:peptidylprolyl isomerase [Actinomycetota bacterium]
MVSLKRLSVLLVALAVVVAGCSGATVAATVTGVEIQDEDVFPLAGSTDSDIRVSGDAFRGTLTLLVIQRALLQAAAEDFGLVDLANQPALDAFLQNIPQAQFDAIRGAVDVGIQAGRDPEASANYIVTGQLIVSSVREALLADPAFLQDVFAQFSEVLVATCVSHILVASPEEAAAVIDRLAAGEDFAAVAADVSIDTQSPGGALPCPSSPYPLGPEFGDGVLAAPVGEVSGPLVTEFGFHVLLVTSKDGPESFDDFFADPSRWLPPQLLDSGYADWEQRAIDRADISVRSQVGTWVPEAVGISAPPASP